MTVSIYYYNIAPFLIIHFSSQAAGRELQRAGRIEHIFAIQNHWGRGICSVASFGESEGPLPDSCTIHLRQSRTLYWGSSCLPWAIRYFWVPIPRRDGAESGP